MMPSASDHGLNIRFALLYDLKFRALLPLYVTLYVERVIKGRLTG